MTSQEIEISDVFYGKGAMRTMFCCAFAMQDIRLTINLRDNM